MKKAQSLPLQTIIVLIIILIVLAVILFAFYNYGGEPMKAMAERISNIVGFANETTIGKI